MDWTIEVHPDDGGDTKMIDLPDFEVSEDGNMEPALYTIYTRYLYTRRDSLIHNLLKNMLSFRSGGEGGTFLLIALSQGFCGFSKFLLR
jgi:hypothetical protein